MHTRYAVHSQHLVDGVLISPGETDPALRREIEAQAAQLSLRSPQPGVQVPPALATYVKKVALYAYKTTEEDIEDALVVCVLFNIIDRMADALDVAIPSAEGFARTAERLLEHGYL